MKTEKETIELCDNCEKNEAKEPHLCPYAVELHNSDKLCNCCDSCTHECAMDI